MLKRIFGKTDKNSREMIQSIERYFKNSYFIDFLDSYDKLFLNRTDLHYFNSFGVNILDERVISVKFYAHFCDDLTEEELLQFLPTTDDYKKYIEFKANKSDSFDLRNVGVALELKFKEGHEKPVVGFFYNLKNSTESYKEFGFPKSIPSDFQKDCEAIGINFEYEHEKKLFKKYYYFTQKEKIQYFSNRFQHDFIKNANVVEYAESDEMSKINTMLNKEDFLKLKSDLKTFSKSEQIVINHFIKKYDLFNFVFGIYEQKNTKVLYFFAHFEFGDGLYNVNTLQKLKKNI